MTSPSDKPEKVSLINFERMNREVICLNPTHSTVQLQTTEIEPQCPICNNVMVRVVRSVMTGEPFDVSDKE